MLSRSCCGVLGEDVERGRQWAGCPALAVTAQCLSDGLDVGSVLQRKAAADCGIAGRSVCSAPAFMISQENFGEAAVIEAGNGRGIVQAGANEIESLAPAAIGQALAGCAHEGPLLCRLRHATNACAAWMRNDGLRGEIRRGRGGKMGAKIGGIALMFSKPCARIRRWLWARLQLIFDMRSPVG
jgi:hypothetical protein